jgi:long-chain fatty acid transport protein
MKHAIPTLLVALALAFALPERARAGGLYLTDRGVRALGRGGAFVAGADDGQSLWYNPAGLAYTKPKHVLMDGTLPLLHASFQRVTRDNVNGPSPKVDANPLLLPIPTFAVADDLGLDDFAFGFAVMAPTAVTLRWPESAGVMPDGTPRPPPTRYSLISMQGSAIADIALGAAYRGIEGLSIGAGLHVIPSRFHAGVYLSACDYGTLCQQPEQPDYDAKATIDLNLAITATPQLGLIYELGMFRIGASVLFFYDIKGKAKLNTQLPSAPLFGPSDECTSSEARRTNPHCAHVVGDKADIRLAMPMIARFGIEFRPTDTFRAEAGVVYEGWSRQQDFRITPRNIRIDNALGIPSYAVGPISVPRDMRDVWSLRLGGEYEIDHPMLPVTLRAGCILENGAFPNKTLTPLTLDSNKAVVSLGMSVKWFDNVYVDVMYAHMFMADPKVRNSIVYPQNPLRPPYQAAPNDPVAAPEAVGNGNYTMEADLLGGGLRMNL